MRRGNEQTARGEGVHETMQAEAALMALGHPPDIPLLDIALHLAECAECRRFATEVSEAMGHLPEALEQVRPPASLRAKIVDLAGRDDAAAADGLNGKTAPRAAAAPATAEPATVAPVARERAVSKPAAGLPRRLRRAVAAAAVLALLIAVNGVWWQHARSRDVALAELERRYAAEAQWLRSAERLLVHAEPPAYKGTLADPGRQSDPGAAPATGRAAVYTTAYDRVYLITHAEGLRPAAPYSTWIQHEGDSVHLGDFTAEADGTGNYVYAADAEQWPLPSGEALVLTVIDESTGEEALRGLLAPSWSPGAAEM